MRQLVVLSLVLAGCGRVRFEERVGDGGPVDALDAMPDAPMPLPVAGWRLDDGTGTTAADWTGHGYTMSLVNGPLWTAGQFAGGVSTDGVDDYLFTPPIALSATSAITISFWVNRSYTNGPRHTLLELSTNFNGVFDGAGMFPDDNTTCAGGQILLGVRGDVGEQLSCVPQPSSGVWHHLVVVYDKTLPGTQETALFVDGAPVAAASVPLPSDNTNSFGNEPLYLGARGGTGEFNAATFDEISIFDRALTPAEIAAM